MAPGGVWEGSIYLRGGGDPTFGSSAFIAHHYGGVGSSVARSPASSRAPTASARSRAGSRATKRCSTRSAGSPPAAMRRTPSWKARSARWPSTAAQTGSERGPHAPAAYAARQLRAALKAAGVSRARLERGRHDARRARCRWPRSPPHDLPAARPDAAALGQLLRRDAAEGARGAPRRGRAPPAPGHRWPSATIGSLLGIHPRIVDGSGLSEADRTSPYQVADLLVELTRRPSGRCCAKTWRSRGAPGRWN